MDDVDPNDIPVLDPGEGKSYKTISHLPVSRFPPHVLHHLLRDNPPSKIEESTGQYGVFPEPPYIYHPKSSPLPQVYHGNIPWQNRPNVPVSPTINTAKNGNRKRLYESSSIPTMISQKDQFYR